MTIKCLHQREELDAKMKTAANLVALQTSVHRMHKNGHRLWLMVLISFVMFSCFAALLLREVRKSYGVNRVEGSWILQSVNKSTEALIPEEAIRALLHYASQNASPCAATAAQMNHQDLSVIAQVTVQRSPCNFLVFGLGHESFLWKTLNFAGRTVFVDDNEILVTKFEEKHPKAEAYDIKYTTRVHEALDLLKQARKEQQTECRAVQDLLFSDCKLAINDLPNELYQVEWDVILIDGPKGYFSNAPGRMSAIFTSAVLARSKADRTRSTHIFVHDFNREVERVFSEEFLCKENMVFSSQHLAHFIIRPPAHAELPTAFCKDPPSSLSSFLSSETRIRIKGRYRADLD